MNRTRLTITLRKDLLRQIDRTIDGTEIRNRSHAIEALLTRAVQSRTKLAVILAGGEGIKMRPLTYEIPKPMIPIKSRPLMEYTIDLIKKAGIQKIIVSLGSKGKMIRDHFGDGRRFGIEIIYSEEEKPLGTAGPLRQAANVLKDEPFFVLYGDILADINLAAIEDFHRENQALATMVLTSVLKSTAYGVVELDGSQVRRFSEEPFPGKGAAAGLTNAGIYIFEPEILNYIPKTGKAMLEDIFPTLIKAKELYGYLFSGQWFDLTTPKEYEKAIKEWGIN